MSNDDIVRSIPVPAVTQVDSPVQSPLFSVASPGAHRSVDVGNQSAHSRTLFSEPTADHASSHTDNAELSFERDSESGRYTVNLSQPQSSQAPLPDHQEQAPTVGIHKVPLVLQRIILYQHPIVQTIIKFSPRNKIVSIIVEELIIILSQFQ